MSRTRINVLHTLSRPQPLAELERLLRAAHTVYTSFSSCGVRPIVEKSLMNPSGISYVGANPTLVDELWSAGRAAEHVCLLYDKESPLDYFGDEQQHLALLLFSLVPGTARLRIELEPASPAVSAAVDATASADSLWRLHYQLHVGATDLERVFKAKDPELALEELIAEYVRNSGLFYALTFPSIMPMGLIEDGINLGKWLCEDRFVYDSSLPFVREARVRLGWDFSFPYLFHRAAKYGRGVAKWSDEDATQLAEQLKTYQDPIWCKLFCY